MERAEEYRRRIDQALEEYFVPRGLSWDRLREAERYSLLAGGKRIRPMLVLEFCRLCGGDVDSAMPAACAVEMLHTYSLIHDDLPCMDNDDLRRGKPTNHVVFGVCTATLAGDALQADAFATVLKSSLPDGRRARCALFLAEAAGGDGMCAGQYLDTSAPQDRAGIAGLTEVHTLKTGTLIRAACKMGVAAAGGSEKQLQAADGYGAALGLAFQIRDDMLDATATTRELGKPAGSDEREGKTTFVGLLGYEACEKKVTELTEKAKESLSEFEDAAFLSSLADALAGRKF